MRYSIHTFMRNPSEKNCTFETLAVANISYPTPTSDIILFSQDHWNSGLPEFQ
jgi:hypothetical protein